MCGGGRIFTVKTAKTAKGAKDEPPMPRNFGGGSQETGKSVVNKSGAWASCPLRSSRQIRSAAWGRRLFDGKRVEDPMTSRQLRAHHDQAFGWSRGFHWIDGDHGFRGAGHYALCRASFSL